MAGVGLAGVMVLLKLLLFWGLATGGLKLGFPIIDSKSKSPNGSSSVLKPVYLKMLSNKF